MYYISYQEYNAVYYMSYQEYNAVYYMDGSCHISVYIDRQHYNYMLVLAAVSPVLKI